MISWKKFTLVALVLVSFLAAFRLCIYPTIAFKTVLGVKPGGVCAVSAKTRGTDMIFRFPHEREDVFTQLVDLHELGLTPASDRHAEVELLRSCGWSVSTTGDARFGMNLVSGGLITILSDSWHYYVIVRKI